MQHIKLFEKEGYSNKLFPEQSQAFDVFLDNIFQPFFIVAKWLLDAVSNKIK